MKKFVSVLAVFVLTLVFAGCVSEKNKNSNPTESVPSSEAASSYVGEKEAYIDFLKEAYKKDSSKDTNTFLIRDLDGNGTLELIYRHSDLEVTVYTYDNGVKKIDFHNFASGSTRLFTSDNPSYPGLFEFHVSGGLEKYTYITIKNEKLLFKELWDEDYSDFYEDRERIVEYTSDKSLIEESKRLYKGNKDASFSLLESIAES